MSNKPNLEDFKKYLISTIKFFDFIPKKEIIDPLSDYYKLLSLIGKIYYQTDTITVSELLSKIKIDDVMEKNDNNQEKKYDTNMAITDDIMSEIFVRELYRKNLQNLCTTIEEPYFQKNTRYCDKKNNQLIIRDRPKHIFLNHNIIDNTIGNTCNDNTINPTNHNIYDTRNNIYDTLNNIHDTQNNIHDTRNNIYDTRNNIHNMQNNIHDKNKDKSVLIINHELINKPKNNYDSKEKNKKKISIFKTTIHDDKNNDKSSDDDCNDKSYMCDKSHVHHKNYKPENTDDIDKKIASIRKLLMNLEENITHRP